jgi:hypothetical protein
MDKFSVDMSKVIDQLSQKKRIRLADVKDRLCKVAFDVVRFVDSDRIDDLWRIERDGEDEYIVALYEMEEPLTALASAPNPWSVEIESARGKAHVFYKKAHITCLNFTELGIPQSDSHLVPNMLVSKLANDQKFLNVFVTHLTDAERETLSEENPSLVSGL